MAEIVISGDSWGCGVWNDDKHGYSNTHRGIEQFLKDDGHNVANVSQGGFSNHESILHLRNYVSDNPECKVAIWFQSDSLRDLRPYTNFNELYTTYNDLIKKQHLLLVENYNQLDTIGIPIICLGGCSKLNLDLMPRHRHLIPVVPAITELLLPNYTHPEIWISDWIDLVARQFSLNCLDNINNSKRAQDHLFKEKELFWPDGRHPNVKGWRIVYDYLISNRKVQSLL